MSEKKVKVVRQNREKARITTDKKKMQKDYLKKKLADINIKKKQPKKEMGSKKL